MIVLLEQTLCEHGRPGVSAGLRLRCRDGGDVYTPIGAEGAPDAIDATLYTARAGRNVEPTDIGAPDDRVRILVREHETTNTARGDSSGAGDQWDARGFVRRGDRWDSVPVAVVPMERELFSRTRGLFETDILADKCIFTAGLGSLGAPVALEWAKIGVRNHILLDHDRVEVANIVRHVAGLSDTGRYKTKVMTEAICDKNPYARVRTCRRKITWDTFEQVRGFVRDSDLVVCAADGKDARVILNALCLEEHKPVIFAGAFRRAYGGQVLFVRPGSGPCFECFQRGVTDKARDREISSTEQAEEVAYSDRPVAIEPGLSNDIAPLSQMVVKLGLQHLLAGKRTTLQSLDEDLIASWYIWLNRREAETEYEQLKPMAYFIDGPRVLRWYGIKFERDPQCPVCGDFLNVAARQEGIDISPEAVAAFSGAEDAQRGEP